MPAWSHPLPARPRGLSLARERGWLLAWDESGWLYLLDRDGRRQAQRQLQPLTAAALADDGSSCVAVGGTDVWWLAPDLSTRAQARLPAAALAVALDPFGQYAAATDDRGGLHLVDQGGLVVGAGTSPRPLHHVAFAASAPFLVAAGDYGFVAAYDLAGRCLWRDAPVAHIGSLAVTGDGRLTLLACFSEGLLRYDDQGRKVDRLLAAEQCRLVSASYNGDKLLIAGLKHRILLTDAAGRTLWTQELERSAVALALGPLGDAAVLALADGNVVSQQLEG